MKKILLLSIAAMLSFSAITQQLFFEAYSGYGLTAYDDDKYSDSQGFIPLGFKIAGGHEHVQAGFDFRRYITQPNFELGDLVNRKHQFNEDYYGAFVRGNISSLPAYRIGLILGAGMGYYQPTMEVYAIDIETDPIETIEYEKFLGYNFYIGVSAPIWAQLHWEIGYEFNMTDRPELLTQKIPGYAANYHLIHVGLSGNFVFGNTEKACRRTMINRDKGRR